MTFLGLRPEQWMDLGISLGMLAVTVAVGRWLVSLALERGMRWLTRRTRTTLDDLVLGVLRPAVYWGIVIAVARVALQRIDFLPFAWKVVLPEVFFVAMFLVILAFVWRLVAALTDWFGERAAAEASARLDKRWMPLFRRLALIVVGSVGLVILLDHFDVDISALIATLGIGSLAFALAAQTSISDMISGFLIMIDQPFRVGDRIEILDLDTWGDVVDIGLRSTRVRTRDNRMVIVPNSVISKSLVVNHTYPDSQYRIQIHLGVAYGTDLDLARNTMIEAVRGVEGVVESRPVEALFLEFGDSAMIFRVRWWIESYVDTRRMFDSVNSALYAALEEAGIEMPFPTQELFHHVDADSSQRLANALRGS